jgi:hypothetical protein
MLNTNDNIVQAVDCKYRVPCISLVGVHFTATHLTIRSFLLQLRLERQQLMYGSNKIAYWFVTKCTDSVLQDFLCASSVIWFVKWQISVESVFRKVYVRL